MKVTQYSMRLTKNQVQAQEKKASIRTVQLPGDYCYYYSKRNLLARLNSQFIEIYSIHENKVQRKNNYLRRYFNQEIEIPKQVLFLENNLIIQQDYHIMKININNYDQPQIFQRDLPQEIIKYRQINDKSYMIMIKEDSRLKVNPLAIHSLRNCKKSYTSFKKMKISSLQYHKHIVQALTLNRLYYFNTKMTKQIRKFRYYCQDEPIFNSNLLIVPIEWQFDKGLDQLIIYDIQSMKRKGFIEGRSHLLYESCIYIKDFNIIGVLYNTELDLYDFRTLKCINSSQINNKGNKELVMKYDEYNGLTIFIRRS